MPPRAPRPCTPSPPPRARARSGLSVPQIRLVTVSPRPGESLHALAARLRADPRVASVARRAPRGAALQPNDPALVTPEAARDAVPGTPVEWWAARERLPAGLGHHARAAARRVAVIDTGVEIGHPELAGRVAGRRPVDAARSPAGHDDDGHGTHVASLACATGEQRRRPRRRRARLPAPGHQVRPQRLERRRIDRVGGRPRRRRDQHELRHRRRAPAPSLPVVNAHRLRRTRTASCSSSAAADDPIEEQGYPANVLQPTGTGPDINAGQRPVGHGRRLPRPPRAASPGAARRSRSPPTAPTSGNGNDGPPRDLRRVHLRA